MRIVCRQSLVSLAALLGVLVCAVSQAAAADPVVVTSTVPADGASDVPLNTTITITFNQPVTVTGTWVEMFCFTSGGHALTVSGGPQTWQLTPQGALSANEACAVTVKASNVDGMVSNYTFTFTTASAPPPNNPPTADAGGPYAVNEGGSVGLSATGSDPESGPLTYAWDLDGDGTFETAGQTVTFSAAALDGPGTRTVTVRVTDNAGQAATDTAQVTIMNVAPTATFSAPASAVAGLPFTLSLTGASDPSVADTAAGFTYAFDCGDGDGYGPFGSSSSASCEAAAGDTLDVGGMIRDKDGDFTEYRATVQVLVTFAGLCDRVQLVVAKPGVADALCAKLHAAEEAADRGQLNAEQNELQAFRNELAAQTGKAVSPDDAKLLATLSDGL